MGLHTQDAVRGEYSVLAPQGALYEEGRCRGRVSTTLNDGCAKHSLPHCSCIAGTYSESNYV